MAVSPAVMSGKRRPERSSTGLGDFVFYAVVLYLVIAYTDLIWQPWLVGGIAVVFLVRIINLVITKAKFGIWGTLHSWANKATGLFLFVCIPFGLVNGSVPFVVGIALCIVAMVSSLEETIILPTEEEYNANRKSYFR